MILKYDGNINYSFFLSIYKCMLSSENTIKTIAIYYHNQLFIFY